MNPFKSLMACALLALWTWLAAPAAAGSWRQFSAAGKTYVVDEASLKALAVGAETPAYAKPGQTDTVAGKLKKKTATDYVFIANGSTAEVAAQVKPETPALPKQTTTQNNTGGQKKSGASTRPAGPPSGVDAEAWALVEKDARYKTRQQKVEAAKALQRFKKDAPEDFAALKSAPADKRAAAIPIVVGGVNPNFTVDEGTKKALHDRLAQALGGQPPAENTAQQPNLTTPTPEKKDQPVVREEDPINTLTTLLTQNPEASTYAQARFGRYFLRTDKPFVEPAYLTSAEGKEAKVPERLQAAIKSWVEDKVSKKQNLMFVSELLYVLGFDEGMPKWANGHPSLEILADKTLRGSYPREMEKAMEGWTAGTKSSMDTKGKVAPGAYAGAPVKVDEWALSLLEFAGGKAHQIYAARAKDENRLRKEIGDNSDGSVTPGDTRDQRRRANGTSRSWGVDEMYEAPPKGGAVVGNIVVGKGGEYRRISLKIVTSRDKDGKMIDQLAITDISEPGKPGATSNIFGQTFPLGQTGESVFRLDDRKAGTLKYKLTMTNDKDGNKVIKFGTPDGKSEITTSESELVQRRADQVKNSRTVREIGGQRFKIIPQGGENGALLYYPVDKNDKVVGDARTPSLMAKVSGLGPNSSGRTENLAPPDTAVGFVGKPKDDKSNFYYLVWNDELKFFEPKSCVDIKKPCEYPADAKPAPTNTASRTNTPSSTGNQTTSEQTNNTSSTTTTNGEQTNNTTSEPGNTTNGEQSGSEAALKACTLQEEAFNYKLKRQVDSAKGFTYFLTKDGGNAFQLCVNRDKSIFFQGVPIWGNIRTDQKHLIVEAVSPKSGMIPAEEEVNGHVAGNEYKVNGRPSYELSGRTMYYFKMEKVSGEAIAASGNNTIYADQTAWLSFIVDPRNREARVMQVRIKDTDPGKAEAAIREAYKIGNASKSAFADEQSIGTIIAHVKKELPRYDGKNKPMLKKPMIEINLFVKKESSDNTPAVVATIQAAGRKEGVDDKGEDIITAEQYDDLLYCYQTAKLEGRAAHNAHLKAATGGGQ